MTRLGGALLIVLGSPIAGWGIWLLSTEDVQGGRREMGILCLAIGGLLALAGIALFSLGGRSRA